MKIIIIGAGASGMMAAVGLKERGLDVTVIERNEKVMKKIYATGNGRCNFTNTQLKWTNYHGANPKFVLSAIHAFDQKDTIDYFNRLGIKETVLKQGKVYPLSLRAACVAQQFELYANHLHIPIRLNEYVSQVQKKGEVFEVSTDRRKDTADAVIVATGGFIYPTMGSDGTGYRLAESMGHTITDLHPGIVQLRLKGNAHEKMNGTRFVAKVYLVVDGKKKMEQWDDVLFTDYGISGPTILQISGEAIRMLRRKKRVFLSVDLLYDFDENTLFEYFVYYFSMSPYKTLGEALTGWIHENLVQEVVYAAKLSPDKKVAELDKESVYQLVKTLKDWRFEVENFKSKNDGQVSCGGISTKEIHPKTMESKIAENLYFTGEVMDIDGDCGGYNLQWAWSSAVAVCNAIECKRSE